MTPEVTNLWRHPIKSHGREAVRRVALSPGEAMPWDRHWAVVHENTAYDGEGWARSANFMIGTRVPGLAGIWAELDEAAARLTLRHEKLGAIDVCPDLPEDASRLLAWVAPLVPENRAQARAIVKIGPRGMTDTNYASVSLMSRASHRAVERQIGAALHPERWRGNIWIDGSEPWQEFDWIGKRIRIGTAVLELHEPIVRCLHTTANPRTGERDVDTLGALSDGFGHKNFGVYARVIEPGEVGIGDKAMLA